MCIAFATWPVAMHTHERPRCELVLYQAQAGTPAALVSVDSSCGRGEKVIGAKISHKEAKNSQRPGRTRGEGQTPRGAGVLMRA